MRLHIFYLLISPLLWPSITDGSIVFFSASAAFDQTSNFGHHELDGVSAFKADAVAILRLAAASASFNVVASPTSNRRVTS